MDLIAIEAWLFQLVDIKTASGFISSSINFHLFSSPQYCAILSCRSPFPISLATFEIFLQESSYKSLIATISTPSKLAKERK